MLPAHLAESIRKQVLVYLQAPENSDWSQWGQTLEPMGSNIDN
jgi:hypothetical protein